MSTLMMKQSVLKKLINSVKFAMPTKDRRPYLNGIHFCLDGEQLMLTATDDLAMARNDTRDFLECSKEGVSAIVSATAIKELCRALKDHQTLTLNIHPENVTAHLESPSGKITPMQLTTVEYKYLNFNNVLAYRDNPAVKVDRVELLKAVELAKEGVRAGCGIPFTISEDHISFNNRDQATKDCKKIGCEVELESNDIGRTMLATLNPVSVGRVLRAIKSTLVSIAAVGEKTPVAFSDVGNYEHYAVIQST